MSYQRRILEKPEWWQQLDEYIAEQKARNADRVQSALIPVLHHLQDTFGYVPEKAINHVAQALGVPTSYVAGVASFYSYFSLTPKGMYTVSVCMGTACYVRGGQELVDRFAKELGIEPGETTPDGLFTLELARCLGACGQAPAVMVNGRIHGTVKPEDVQELIAYYTAEAQAEEEAEVAAS
jgi:NADH-quinone oxidoreductase subunit E